VAGGGSRQHPRDFRIIVEDAKAVATVLAMEAESVLATRTARVLGLFYVAINVM
jgi:hypothetical protein